MAFNDLLTNQMVMYKDAVGFFTLKQGQSDIVSITCFTKSIALSRYNLDPSLMNEYVDHQLVPKSVWLDLGDTTSPGDIINLICTSITDSFGSFDHSGAIASNGVSALIYYDIDGKVIAQVNAGGTNFALVDFFIGYTNYTMKLKVRDKLGNYSLNFSNTIAFRTLPSRINPNAQNIGNNSIQCSWVNSIGTTSVDLVYYNSATFQGEQFINVQSPFNVNNLNPGDQYVFFLRMNDSTNQLKQVGEWSTGGTTITVASIATQSPPTAINVASTVDNLVPSILVMWDVPADNQGDYEYVIFRKVNNGEYSEITITTSSSFNDILVIYGHTFTYKIRVRDNFGNISEFSNTTSQFPIEPSQPPPGGDQPISSNG